MKKGGRSFWYRTLAGICIFMMKKEKDLRANTMLLCGKNMEEVSMLMKMETGKELSSKLFMSDKSVRYGIWIT